MSPFLLRPIPLFTWHRAGNGADTSSIRCTTGKNRRGSAAEAAIVEDLIMRTSLKQKIIAVCDTKINQKGANVGLSFYAFFHNRNDDPELLMQAATWWIQTHKLDHFEKATKIKRMVELELS
ncbi:MAG TPA: DUF6500 family protein [Burkholderiaceae bacterium]|nr:DUF6500 family protein [Burkholderiaceae bacterium]HRA62996.1 DUF6500 family protein [Burkholderiaceae bacterium]